MTGHLIRHTPGVVTRPAGRPGSTAGPSISTSGTDFTATADTWDALPAESQDAAQWGTDVVAEHVETLTRGALKIDGVPHQRMIGWRAHLDRVVVVTAVRPLRKRPDGRMAPSGSWQHRGVAVHPSEDPVRRREGVIRVDPGSPDGATPGVPGPRLPVDQQHAAESCSYLPSAVQQGLLDAVAEPTLWLGALVQWSENDYPVRQQLDCLRLDDRRAVALTARRALPGDRTFRAPAEARDTLAGTSWTVTQYTYELETARPANRGVLGRGARR